MRKEADVPPTRLKGKKYRRRRLVILDEVGFGRSAARRRTCFPDGELSLQRRFGASPRMQGDQGLAGDAGGDDGDHGGVMDRLLHACHVLKHPRAELSSSRPGGRLTDGREECSRKVNRPCSLVDLFSERALGSLPRRRGIVMGLLGVPDARDRGGSAGACTRRFCSDGMALEEPSPSF